MAWPRPASSTQQVVIAALYSKIQMIDRVKPNGRTQIASDGTASLPSNAPPVVQWIVAAANKILHSSYCYAGGHGSWTDIPIGQATPCTVARCSTCSATRTLLESYGAPGRGRWVTIYADSGHTFLVVDGRAFDTADYGGPITALGDRSPKAQRRAATSPTAATTSSGTRPGCKGQAIVKRTPRP